MMYLDWFVGTMKKTFNIEVKREEIGYEAHDFYHEELDDLLVMYLRRKREKSCTKYG